MGSALRDGAAGVIRMRVSGPPVYAPLYKRKTVIFWAMQISRFSQFSDNLKATHARACA